MIIIADGGATKTSWCLIENVDKTTLFETEGYHPFFVDCSYISNSLHQNIPENIREMALEVTVIYFYSAGGGYSKKTDAVIIDGVKSLFPQAEVFVETDLLAAARALLQDNPGFAGILGTGTNTCIYNGKKIIQNIESLGFLLGDEGSGSYIGKKIIGDYIRGYMPSDVKKQFKVYCGMTADELIDQLYTKPSANRFCAKFSRFVGDNLQRNEYYRKIVYDSFYDLFNNIIVHYTRYRNYTFNCVGSIAYHFQPILEDVVSDYGMKMGKIEKEPMKGLVEFHLKNNRL